MRPFKLTHFIVFSIIIRIGTFAQNPVIRDQFTADPSIRLFNDKLYLYPSHDILAVEGKGRPGWFCMEDYHVFSSSNLTDWVDHGVIISQGNVGWVNDTLYSMWAPDCIYRNGKYYFYFPSIAKDTSLGRGFSIGVAVSDNPAGPFIPESKPIAGVRGIDPNVFIDHDGQAYLYWSARKFYVAKLKENMLELDSEPMEIANLPEAGLKEGPWIFERKGLYYLTYPHVQNKTERLEYAIGNNPMGPFKVAGVIMDEHATGCWTNHQSVVEYNGQWYLFYHHNDYSPNFDKNRSVCIDSLFFNEDGTIQKVVPTHRGVGLTAASSRIEIDRYSSISNSGVSIAFIDTLDTFKGWKAIFDKPAVSLQYNAVDFGKVKYRFVSVRAASQTGGRIQIRLGSANGQILSEIAITRGTGWFTHEQAILFSPEGIQNLYIILTEKDKNIEIDWIQFLEKTNQPN